MLTVITGATGHIGNVLVRELLKNKERVRVILLKEEPTFPIDSLNVEKFYGNIVDKESLRIAFEGADTVYHLASKISILPNENLDKVNIDGTKNVADLCLEMNIKLLYVSSVQAISVFRNREVIDENNVMDENYIIGNYGKTKAKATKYVLYLVKEKHLKAIIVHPSAVVGPNDYLFSNIGVSILAIMKGLFTLMDTECNYVDVRDAVRGIILACEKGHYGERYILSGVRVSLKEEKRLIDKTLCRPHWYINIPKFLVRFIAFVLTPLYKPLNIKPFLTTESLEILYLNPEFINNKAKNELGWSIRSFEETIKDTVYWIKNNKKLINT